MCLFIESIKYKNGAFYRLDLHQMRVNLVFKLYFPGFKPFQLSEIPAFKLFKKEGIYKCRIVFDNNIKEISILPYERKNFESFQLVESDIDSLPYKRAERTELNNAFQQKENCSDIIVVKNGYLTDSSYANIALWNGKKWVTPSNPLIFGTQRQFLITDNQIIEGEIHLNDLQKYSKIRIFNAMIEFGEVENDISCIHQIVKRSPSNTN